jgi:hypothetical protein
MNITIPIEVSGDLWYNEQAVKQQLEQLPGHAEITLDLRSEGPSLCRLGIMAVIDAWLAQHRLPPDVVTITRWSNSGESVAYKKFKCSVPSHFWRYAREYQLPAEQSFGGAKSNLFGLFLGRATISRNVIMYQVQQHWANRFLISRLPSFTPEGTRMPEPWHIVNHLGWRNHESLIEWAGQDQQKIIDWFACQSFTSLDNRNHRDQFGDPNNHFVHNRSMISHYHKFNIELVCESYTLGQTFFPTEKTVRPIVATRPWIIYAAPGYIQQLKSMGFGSFDTLWDESYDQLEGPARWSAMKTVIQQLVDLDSDALNSVLHQAHAIALHNRMRFGKLFPC